MTTRRTGERRDHPRLLALGLLLLAPLVGEYLLGNTPITELPAVLVLAPMYGGGAVLIREVTRRVGLGWPTMVLLAVAYSLVEEALIDQMLFNPGYLGLDSFAGFAPIPGTGLSATLIQGTLTLHTVWSICVPIAIVETFSRDRTRPWLGNLGLGVTGLVFVAGSLLLAVDQAVDLDFVASPLQFAASSVVILALVVLAFLAGRRPPRPSDRPAPAPRLVAVAAFGLSSGYWAEASVESYVGTEWVSVAWWFVLVGVSVPLFLNWSRRRGWDATHRLAMAGGALLTYTWVGFVNGQQLGLSFPVAALGNTVFGAAAVILLVLAVRHVGEQRTAPERTSSAGRSGR